MFLHIERKNGLLGDALVQMYICHKKLQHITVDGVNKKK